MDSNNKYTNNGMTSPPLTSSDHTLAATGMRAADTLLRLVPMGLCVAALIVMLKNSQIDDYGSVAYSDLGAFKYVIFLNIYVQRKKKSFFFSSSFLAFLYGFCEIWIFFFLTNNYFVFIFEIWICFIRIMVCLLTK